MTNWRNSWTVYSIGLGIVWAIVLILVWLIDTSAQLRMVALLFAGFFVGWLSATIKFIIIRRRQSTGKN